MAATPPWLCGDRRAVSERDFGDIAFNDSRTAFFVRHAKDRDVLDLGCVQHNPENYKSRYWLHEAIRRVARSVVGLDLYEPGVQYLCEQGYDVKVGNAEAFTLDRKFDVIAAGDLIEHLEDLRGFLTSCAKHLRTGGKLLITTPNPWYWRNIVKQGLFQHVWNNPEHTMWLCPTVLAQLCARHQMKVCEIEFGSRSLRDRLLPLPTGIKHTTFFASIEVKLHD